VPIRPAGDERDRGGLQNLLRSTGTGPKGDEDTVCGGEESDMKEPSRGCPLE